MNSHNLAGSQPRARCPSRDLKGPGLQLGVLPPLHLPSTIPREPPGAPKQLSWGLLRLPGRDAAAACVALSALACGCPTIVTRAQWQARSPTGRTSLSTPVPYVIIHHTAGSSCTSQASCSQVVRGIQNYHMDSQGWSDISYNFLIGEDGRVYEGRGWTTRGAHATNWNSKSLGISFLGTFTNRVPNAAALNAATSLIQCAVSRGALSNSYTLKGHCNVGQTSCPGDALYKVITQWPNFKA